MASVGMPFPTELVLNVIAICCGDYIDTLVFEVSQLARNLRSTTPSGGSDLILRPIDAGDSQLLKQNPVTALLQTSYQVREITLSILSQGMYIPRQKDGRLSTKPWTIIQSLRQHSVDPLYSIDFKSKESTSCFFMGYVILFMVPAEFYRLETGISILDIGRLRRVLRIASQVWDLCNTIKPKAFAEPLLGRLAGCFKMMEIATNLIHLKAEFSVRRIQMELAEGSSYTDVYPVLHNTLFKLGRWGSGRAEDPLEDASDDILGYEIVKIAQIAKIPNELEEIRAVLHPDDYLECRALVTDILTYWTAKFPQMLEDLETVEDQEHEGSETDGVDGADGNPGEEGADV